MGVNKMARTKFNIGDKVIGNDKKASFRERKGVVVSYYQATHQYEVLFEDGRTEYVESNWLDKLE
jgi:hypothetical protein